MFEEGRLNLKVYVAPSSKTLILDLQSVICTSPSQGSNENFTEDDEYNWE